MPREPDDRTPPVTRLDRRSFLRFTGLAGGGLMLGVACGCSREEPAAPGIAAGSAHDGFEPNAFVQVTAERIVIYAPGPEIGQGLKTSLPMIVAEEMDAAWRDVTVLQSDIDSARFEHQSAGGSRSIPNHWLPLRRAGAVARDMLRTAAALRWEVDPAQCQTRDSAVIHPPTGRQLSYLALASAAAELPVPDASSLRLKARSEFRLLGTRVSGVDNAALVVGEPLFGIDVQLPGLRHAVYVKCPARGGRVARANLEEVRSLPGVLNAFVLEGNGNPAELAAGVAIVATDTWSAFTARRSLSVEWDEREAAQDSWSAAQARVAELSAHRGETTLVDKGDVDAAFRDAAQQVSAVYQYAFLGHAQLEPQNTTARWQDGTLELWAPTQTPQAAEAAVAKLLSLEPDKVVLHQRRVGGGFGRRLINDPVLEAAAIAHHIGGAVKLTWTREDDMDHDFYRAGGFHALQGALDARGRVSGWNNHFISFTRDGKTPVSGGGIRGDIDPAPFIPNYRITQTLLPWRTPCGPWRAPGSNVIAFAHQCFLHELAVAAGRDHVEFLLDLLGEPRALHTGRAAGIVEFLSELLGEPRWLARDDSHTLHTGRAAGVIRRAADAAGWGRPLPPGHGLGIAFYYSHAGHIAEVAEVSVGPGKQLNVHRVTVAADVGPIVNLSGAENQVQGSVIDGLSAMLAQRVTFEQGRAQERNFHQYPLLRMPRAPAVDVHFVDSDFPPTGLGEPALPPLAPAVANAIFAATGERVRRMPISEAGWS